MSESAKAIADKLEHATTMRELLQAAQQIESIADYGDLNTLGRIVKRRFEELKPNRR